MGYTVLQASETPGLGAKAATWFQKDGKGSIIGKTPKDGDLHVSKDDKSGNAVDAITASTITSRAFLKAINQAYAVYARRMLTAKAVHLRKQMQRVVYLKLNITKRKDKPI